MVGDKNQSARNPSWATECNTWYALRSANFNRSLTNLLQSKAGIRELFLAGSSDTFNEIPCRHYVLPKEKQHKAKPDDKNKNDLSNGFPYPNIFVLVFHLSLSWTVAVLD